MTAIATSRLIKLVRDEAGDDNDIVLYIGQSLADEDFVWALKRKLIEECLEYMESGEWEELVDIYEVLRTLVRSHGKVIADLRRDANNKRRERGGFSNRVGMWVRRPAGDP